MKGTRELLKSILLVTLVLSSIVLTYMNLFNGLIINGKSSDVADISSSNLSQYINPQSFLVSFGGLSYTKVYDLADQKEIWSVVRPYIESCFLEFESVKEITKAEYNEAFSGKSVLIRMPFNLSVDEFLSLFSEKQSVNTTLKMTPKEYVLKVGNERSLYVYDEVNQKYFQLTNKAKAHDVEPLIRDLKDRGIVEYRKIAERFSLDSTVESPYDRLNYELIPVEQDFAVPSLLVENEVSLDETKFTEEVASISSAIFGNRLDFVKKLKDVNESIILMYGYGDKSLTVTKEGLISYRKKLDHVSAKKTTFKEAFSLAIGRIENFGVIPEGLYLERFTYSKESSTYEFYFNYKLNAYSMTHFSSDEAPVKITVQDNQVVSVDKNIKIFAGEYQTALTMSKGNLYAVDECINDNSLEIVVFYLQDNEKREEVLDPTDYYFPLRSEIKSIDLTYLEWIDNGQSTVKPVWQVVIDQRTYIFDAFSGDLITAYL